jgi:Core-2/I-Branching enzyme
MGIKAATAWTGLVRVRSFPRSGAWLGVRACRSPFSPSFICQRGADWFTLSRRAVLAVEDFQRHRPDVLAYYRRTLIPTESYVQTILTNHPALHLSRDYRRFTLWDQPHMTGPRVLRFSDLDAVTQSGADFARKFDESVDRVVLDEIDRRVHYV